MALPDGSESGSPEQQEAAGGCSLFVDSTEAGRQRTDGVDAVWPDSQHCASDDEGAGWAWTECSVAATAPMAAASGFGNFSRATHEDADVTLCQFGLTTSDTTAACDWPTVESHSFASSVRNSVRTDGASELNASDEDSDGDFGGFINHADQKSPAKTSGQNVAPEEQHACQSPVNSNVAYNTVLPPSLSEAGAAFESEHSPAAFSLKVECAISSAFPASRLAAVDSSCKTRPLDTSGVWLRLLEQLDTVLDSCSWRRSQTRQRLLQSLQVDADNVLSPRDGPTTSLLLPSGNGGGKLGVAQSVHGLPKPPSLPTPSHTSNEEKSSDRDVASSSVSGWQCTLAPSQTNSNTPFEVPVSWQRDSGHVSAPPVISNREAVDTDWTSFFDSCCQSSPTVAAPAVNFLSDLERELLDAPSSLPAATSSERYRQLLAQASLPPSSAPGFSSSAPVAARPALSSLDLLTFSFNSRK